jgi:putative ABC transport system permease protein
MTLRLRAGQDPPRLADALLRRVLPPGKRGESILGDLREEFRASPSRSWYWQQALRLVLRYLAEPSRTTLSTPRRSPMLHDLTSDLRSAFRMFRRNPGTSSLIVMTLALAIGASTIGFAFADLALFRGLPVDDPARVVSLFVSDSHGAEPIRRVSTPDFLDYRDRSRTLERLSAFRQGRAALIKDGQSRALTVTWATGDLFLAMGQSAVQGRTLATGDDAPGAPPVALLSHRYWQEEFSGRPDAVGRTMQVGRDIFTIVGVLTPEMEFGNLAEIDAWLPLHLTPDAPRDTRDLRFIARVRDGFTFDQAAAEMAAIGDALAAEYPVTNGGWKIRLIPIRDMTGGQGFWVVIAMFLLSVGLLMAIATANVSNLVLVRAASRQRELAVRAALGARRGRLVRQLVVEGMVLTIVAAMLAVVCAYGGLQVIAAVSSEPVFRQLAIDVHELSFIGMLTLICPLLFSIAPARTISRADTRQVLAAAGSRGSTASMRGRSSLVVAQVSLAVILLTISTLALRSTNAIYGKPTGMDTRSSLVLTLDFNDAQYVDQSQAAAASLATKEALAGMPGIEHAALISALPILAPESTGAFSVDGNAVPPGESAPIAVITAISAEGASALGLTLLTGEWWNRETTGVAVVSRETAIRYLGGVERAVGRQVSYQSGPNRESARVIGVSNDVELDFTRPPVRIWVSMDRIPRRITYVLKARTDAGGLTADVRTAIAATAPAIPIENMVTFEQGFESARQSDYVIIGMLTGFAGLALLLASAGLFGVVSYSAGQRTAEFGTRMALGATAWDVIRLVSGHSIKLLAIGLVIGLAGGVAVGRTMGSLLNGFSPADPVTLLLVSGLLMTITLVATAIPAFRASRIDPVVALRAE